MPSFATTIQSQNPGNRNPEPDIDAGNDSSADEFALIDGTAKQSIPPIGAPKHIAASIITATGANLDARRLSILGKDPTLDLHPNLSERGQRPSFIRADSAAETTTSSLEKDITNTVPPTRTQTNESLAGILDHLQQLQFEEPSPIISQTARRQNRRSILHFAAVCWCFFLEGWNDGSVGPLLPVIQAHYSVGFTVVSLLFVFNCCGFVIGAGVNVWLNEKIGFGKVMVFGSLLQLITYAIQSPAPPFPVLVFSFFLAGFGMSLQSAQGNGFVGSLRKNKSTKLMMLHASYGLGALCSPLVATHFSQTRHWSFHYIISAGIAVSNTTLLCAVFRFKRQEDVLLEAGQEPDESALHKAPTSHNLYRQIFNIRAVHFMAIYALIYNGIEVTIGGWIVTFIIRERDGGPSAGYISSGFFGGLTLGRLVLMYVNKKVGERKVVFLYMMLSIGLEITIWAVPSIIENAIAIACIGVILGPMYPIFVDHGAQILPTYLFTACMGWISGIGMTGSAALPFVTGILAAKYDIKSLQPLLVAMMCTMLGVWALIPKARRAA